MSDISEKASGFVYDLGEAARQNPLSAALIGMGVLWLFTHGRNTEQGGADLYARSRLDRFSDATGDTFETVRSTLGEGVDSIGDSVTSAKDSLREGSAEVFDSAARVSREYAETASEYVSAIPGSTAEVFDTVQSNLSAVFKAQPLAIGAIGLAIGAGIAAALPSSELETAYLGEASDAIKGKATELASEQKDRVTKVADSVMSAVSKEAGRQGLTLDEAKSAVEGITAKVSRVVTTAGKVISEKSSPKIPSGPAQNPNKPHQPR